MDLFEAGAGGVFTGESTFAILAAAGSIGCDTILGGQPETCVAVFKVDWGEYDFSNHSYDAHGRLVFQEYYDWNRRETSTETWTFDDDNHSVTWQSSSAEAGGTPVVYASLMANYDSRGCISRVEHFDKSGSSISVEMPSYDTEGRLIEDRFDGTGVLPVFYYWPELVLGPCVDTESFDPTWSSATSPPPDGIVDKRIVYTRNADGTAARIEQLETQPHSSMESAIYAEWYNYDAAGNRVLLECDGYSWSRICHGSFDGATDGRMTWSYDNAGRPLSITHDEGADGIVELENTWTYDDLHHRVVLNSDGGYPHPPADGVVDLRTVWTRDDSGNLTEFTSGPPGPGSPASRGTWTYDSVRRETSHQREEYGHVVWRSTTFYSESGLETTIDYDNYMGSIPTYDFSCAHLAVELDGATDYRTIIAHDAAGHEISLREEGRYDDQIGEVCVEGTQDEGADRRLMALDRCK
ncbi:MAG: hypothetical protein HY903_06415 [Deltaproteobacteria bacterium]|nr:hypothetical protein [Deltaproteobacteria bacterium]